MTSELSLLVILCQPLPSENDTRIGWGEFMLAAAQDQVIAEMEGNVE